jgi:hypothetical protein
MMVDYYRAPLNERLVGRGRGLDSTGLPVKSCSGERELSMGKLLLGCVEDPQNTPRMLTRFDTIDSYTQQSCIRDPGAAEPRWPEPAPIVNV